MSRSSRRVSEPATFNSAAAAIQSVARGPAASGVFRLTKRLTIAEAERRAARAGLAVDFRVGDAADLPYPAANFDGVRAERLLIYLENWRQALTEMLRVVRPGGAIALIDGAWPGGCEQFGSVLRRKSQRQPAVPRFPRERQGHAQPAKSRYADPVLTHIFRAGAATTLKRKPDLLREEAYLEQEALSPIRHEYIAGEVYAMTGGTLRHNVIADDLLVLLRGHLRGTPCRAFIGDAKRRVAKLGAHYYPDLMVYCAPALQALTGSETVVQAPLLLAEVMSPSSEGTDRRVKRMTYRTLPSLKECVLIAQDRPEIEIQTRLSDTAWEVAMVTPGDPVTFNSVDRATDFAAVYEESGVEL